MLFLGMLLMTMGGALLLVRLLMALGSGARGVELDVRARRRFGALMLIAGAALCAAGLLLYFGLNVLMV